MPSQHGPGARGPRRARRVLSEFLSATLACLTVAMVVVLGGAGGPVGAVEGPGEGAEARVAVPSGPGASDAVDAPDDGAPHDDAADDDAADHTAADHTAADAAALDPDVVAALPRPGLEVILPAGLPVAEQAAGTSATPVAAVTVGYTAPGDAGQPVLALEADALGLDAVWAVTEVADGWVQVLVPFGRGALASVDPARTNHAAVWVRASDVVVAEARTLTLDLAQRVLTVGDQQFAVGVGRPETPTPTGVCAVVGVVHDPSVGEALLTSCQSEAMDEYHEGTGYAVVALHADPEGGIAVGDARSNGCIRMHVSDVPELLAVAQAGDTLVIR